MSVILPPVLAFVLAHPSALGATTQQRETLQAFSLLLLGAALSTLATLNFSLAMVIGVCAAPLAFARPLPSLLKLGQGAPLSTLKTLACVIPITTIFIAVSPPVLLLLLPQIARLMSIDASLDYILVQMARAWVAQGVWTSFIIWAVWWPAWILGTMSAIGGAMGVWL